MVEGFSSRLPDTAAENAWSRRRAARRRRGSQFLDLTVSNPTQVGLPPGVAALDALLEAGGACYAPEPRGLLVARQAVARKLTRPGAAIEAEQVVLTASTSEAYGFLFKLLCEPGDAVLVPAPGYPLFEQLASLEAVRAVSYPLTLDGAWSLRLDDVRRLLTPSTRAIVLITPHNPTGWCLAPDQARELEALAAEHGVAIIADEVFADFRFSGGAWNDAAPAPAATACLAGQGDLGLVFSMGGLSKAAGLPQMKVSWLLVGGDPGRRAAALDALDVISDAYLSVATPAQQALPSWLREAAAFREALRARLETNRRVLADVPVTGGAGATLLPSGGGWMAVLRLPAVRTDDEDTAALLDRHDVLVYPGYLFDMPGGTFLVISLLPDPATFRDGAARLRAYLEARTDSA